MVDTDWLCFIGKFAFGDEHSARLVTQDEEACKNICIDKGFTGFVMHNGTAYFKAHPREDLLEKQSEFEGCSLFVAPPHLDHRTTACRDPELLKPLTKSFATVHDRIVNELDLDPVPQLGADVIQNATEELKNAQRTLWDYVENFTAARIQLMERSRLARYLEKARESSRRLTVMLAGNPADFAELSRVTISEEQQDPESVEQLKHMIVVFSTLGTQEWLGSVITGSNFMVQLETSVTVMQGLLQPLRLEGHKEFFPKSQVLLGGVLPLAANDAQASIPEELDSLASIAETLARLFKHDSFLRRSRQQKFNRKMEYLHDFAAALTNVQTALNMALLVRLESFDEKQCGILKGFVTHTQATEAHQLLEKFRDDAIKESLRREIVDRPTLLTASRPVQPAVGGRSVKFAAPVRPSK